MVSAAEQLAALIEYERAAAVITEANPQVIPGLLQTSDYARAILLAALPSLLSMIAPT